MKRINRFRIALSEKSNLSKDQIDSVLHIIMEVLNKASSELRRKNPDKNSAVDANFVRSILRYDGSNGNFYWRVNWVRSPIDSLAGNIRPQDGYIRIGVKGRAYMAHRLAWLYHYGKWPDSEIDHINGVRSDNRIANLRLANRQQQLANSRARGKAGLKGIYQTKSGTWIAQIKVNGKSRHIGTYGNATEANLAYAEEAKKVFSDFSRV